MAKVVSHRKRARYTHFVLNETDYNYRDFLRRYAEDARTRRSGFSLGAWAKSLGLKSTSSLTKVLNGEREAGPELVEKFVRYFRFSPREETQFRNLVLLSKLRENSELKSALVKSLLQSQAETLSSRLLQFDQFELLSSWRHLAIRELTRLPRMRIARLLKVFPELSEDSIARSLSLLSRLGLVSRDRAGHFISTDPAVHTAHEIPSEAIREYHRDSLDLAKKRLEEVPVEERDYQSLVILIDQKNIPALKQKLREFLDGFERDATTPTVDRLYQLQFQLFPVSKAFEETTTQSNSSEV